MEYKVIAIQMKDICESELVIPRLERAVNETIKDGWKPQGGIAIGLIQNRTVDKFILLQAIIKE